MTYRELRESAQTVGIPALLVDIAHTPTFFSCNRSCNCVLFRVESRMLASSDFRNFCTAI